MSDELFDHKAGLVKIGSLTIREHEIVIRHVQAWQEGSGQEKVQLCEIFLS